MPRDGTKNLIPMSERTEEEVKELQKRGGVNSGKARRRKKTMRESMAILLEAPVTPNIEASLKKRGYKGPKLETMQDALDAAIMIQGTMKGDVKAFNAIMDLMGERVQQVEVNTSNEKFAEVLDTWKAQKK